MICLFQPTINPISAAAAAAAAAAAPSVGLADRGSSVVSIAGMVGFMSTVGSFYSIFVLCLQMLMFQ